MSDVSQEAMRRAVEEKKRKLEVRRHTKQHRTTQTHTCAAQATHTPCATQHVTHDNIHACARTRVATHMHATAARATHTACAAYMHTSSMPLV